MSGTLSKQEASLQALHGQRVFRAVLMADLVLRFVFGAAVLIALARVSNLMGLPAQGDAPWAHMWGAMQLGAAILYLPGYFNPASHCWPNLVGITNRAGTIMLFLVFGERLLWFAVFDGVFAVLLAVSYYRYLIAELMSRP